MAAGSQSSSNDLVGPVLEVLPKLLAEGRIDEVLEAVRALIARNEQLERQLAALNHKRMKTNEGVSTAQLMLFVDKLREQQAAEHRDAALTVEQEDEALQARAEAAAERARQKALADKDRPKRSPLKKPLPAELPRRDNVIEVPEAERACPKCGDEREVIGHDVSEVLELIPAQLYVRRDKREKRACRICEAAVVRAPRGEKVVGGGQLGCSVVAQILSDKYDLGTPLHRQRKNFQRMGLSLSTSTLSDQVKWGTELLRPLWLEAIDQVFASHVMHLDGTGIDVLDRDHPKGKRRGALWSIAGASATNPEIAAYFYASTKKAKGQRDGELGPNEILAQRTGILVSDADTLFVEQRKRADLIDCGCNMHARRYFVKALDAGDSRAALVLGAFKGLYQVEDDVRDASPAERLAARREHSTPIYDDIVRWCVAYQRIEPPKSPLGRAIAYLLNHQLALRRFETDGSIPIDNMAAEHNFVSVALTRKNFLFAGSATAGLARRRDTCETPESDDPAGPTQKSGSHVAGRLRGRGILLWSGRGRLPGAPGRVDQPQPRRVRTEPADLSGHLGNDDRRRGGGGALLLGAAVRDRPGVQRSRPAPSQCLGRRRPGDRARVLGGLRRAYA